MPKKADPTPHWQALVDTWFAFYEERYQFQPVFTGAAAKSLKHIARHLQSFTEARQMIWDEPRAKATFLRFLSLAYADQWLRQNFELNVLYAKVNSIIARGQQQQLAGTTPKVTTYELQQALHHLNSAGQ